MVPLSGNLKEVPLHHLLHFLKIRNKTGVLTIRHGSVSKSLSFQDGGILFATSNDPDDSLGEILLKAGKINFKQYELAEASFKTSGKTQGTILVEQGFIKSRDLFETLVLQIKGIALSLFFWEEASYSFKEAPLSQAEAIGIAIDPDEMIQDGLSQIADWTRLARFLPPLHFVFKKNPVQIFKPIKRFSDADWVFNLVDDERSVRDILTLASTRALSCAQVLNVLITTEMLIPFVPVIQKAQETKASTERRRAPRLEEDILWEQKPIALQFKKMREVSAEIMSQNYYQMLNVLPHVDKDGIKRAYFKMAKRYHPDRYRGDAFLEVKNEIESIFVHLTRAYDTLSVDKIRSEYDKWLANPSPQEPQEIKSASDFFACAEVAYAKNDLRDAIYFLEEAIRVSPDSPEKGAIYLRYGQILSHVPGKLHEAVNAFHKSAALDSLKAAAHIELGLSYQRAGLLDKAATAFKEALKREPDNKLAHAELKRS